MGYICNRLMVGVPGPRTLSVLPISIPSTRILIITDTAYFFPHHFLIPKISSTYMSNISSEILFMIYSVHPLPNPITPSVSNTQGRLKTGQSFRYIIEEKNVTPILKTPPRVPIPKIKTYK